MLSVLESSIYIFVYNCINKFCDGMSWQGLPHNAVVFVIWVTSEKTYITGSELFTSQSLGPMSSKKV